MTIGFVDLNAKIKAELFRVLLIELMVLSGGNPGIGYRLVYKARASASSWLSTKKVLI